ncbi:MAG: PEP-CTERM sorting domain-containing protein [Rubrivivax sp.]
MIIGVEAIRAPRCAGCRIGDGATPRSGGCQAMPRHLFSAGATPPFASFFDEIPPMSKIHHLLAAAAMAAAGAAQAVPYQYVDWTAANAAAGTASGTITLPDASAVSVDFSVTLANGNPGSFFFAQTTGGTNYWSPSAPYTSAQVDNAPPTPDIVSLIGGSDTTTYKLSLSEAIKDPIMAIVSLGRPGLAITYEFDRPFEIVSQGTGYWGGTATSLAQLPGNVLQGAEGHGTIQFIGTFDSFSWTAPTSENWHGFQFAIRTTERLEPPPMIPEPATVALWLCGLGFLAGVRRRRS